MDKITKKYSYQSYLGKTATEDAEKDIRNCEIQTGIPVISLPPISRV